MHFKFRAHHLHLQMLYRENTRKIDVSKIHFIKQGSNEYEYSHETRTQSESLTGVGIEMKVTRRRTEEGEGEALIHANSASPIPMPVYAVYDAITDTEPVRE